MYRFMREMESNIFAMELALFGFLLVMLIVYIVGNAIWGADATAAIGLGGLGTGNTIQSGVSQMFSNRSPNYTPLIANKNATPLPVKPRDPGDLT
jgi:hypothetical protein